VENIDTRKYLENLRGKKTSEEFLIENELGVMPPAP
jgi:hypothetical protein